MIYQFLARRFLLIVTRMSAVLVAYRGPHLKRSMQHHPGLIQQAENENLIFGTNLSKMSVLRGSSDGSSLVHRKDHVEIMLRMIQSRLYPEVKSKFLSGFHYVRAVLVGHAEPTLLRLRVAIDVSARLVTVLCWIVKP